MWFHIIITQIKTACDCVLQLWYFFHCRRLRAQQPCARYNHKVYVAPEEQNVPLEWKEMKKNLENPTPRSLVLQLVFDTN